MRMDTGETGKTAQKIARAGNEDGPTGARPGTRAVFVMTPSTVDAAREVLIRLGAPPRLLQHVKLVGEAGELILKKMAELGVDVNADFVRVGIVLHDAGKVLVPLELDGPGAAHEPAGQRILVENGVSAELARVCLSHARWATMEVSLEELLVALADKLWKGVRNSKLEQLVIDGAAARTQRDRWELLIELDTRFEEVAASGPDRLERSKV